MKIKEKALEYHDDCIGCNLCVKRCPMLKEFNVNPKSFFKNIAEGNEINMNIPFSCTFCESCKKVCPKDINYANILKDYRKKLRDDKVKLNGDSVVKFHQHFSFSRNFTTRDKKMNKEGIAFLPGCSLSSYSPEIVHNTYDYLREIYKNIDLMIECCGKPTLTSGYVNQFKRYYSETDNKFKKNNVKTIITACMNCYNTIKENSKDIEVISLWEVIRENGIPEKFKNQYLGEKVKFTIHDPCPSRKYSRIHESVREIVDMLGINVTESKRSKENTDCCGAGAMVGIFNNELFLSMVNERSENLSEDYIICYCESCVEALSQGSKNVIHILDLIFYKNECVENNFSQKNISFAKKWINRYRVCK